MPQYDQFQPKPYRPRMSAYWYLDHWHYLRYALRESSSFFVFYFGVIMLFQIHALRVGPEHYARFEAFLSSPTMIVVNAIALIFLLLHAITWFNLVPRVMFRQILSRPTPDPVAAAPNFVIWIGVSIIVALFILGII